MDDKREKGTFKLSDTDAHIACDFETMGCQSNNKVERSNGLSKIPQRQSVGGENAVEREKKMFKTCLSIERYYVQLLSTQSR